MFLHNTVLVFLLLAVGQENKIFRPVVTVISIVFFFFLYADMDCFIIQSISRSNRTLSHTSSYREVDHCVLRCVPILRLNNAGNLFGYALKVVDAVWDEVSIIP